MIILIHLMFLHKHGNFSLYTSLCSVNNLLRGTKEKRGLHYISKSSLIIAKDMG